MTYCIADGTDYLSSFDNTSISYANPESPVLVFANRWEADIAEDAGHIARLLRVSLGLENPNPSSAFERLYAASRPARPSAIRKDCRFYSSNTGLKCAVHPELDCCECPSFEPK